MRPLEPFGQADVYSTISLLRFIQNEWVNNYTWHGFFCFCFSKVTPSLLPVVLWPKHKKPWQLIIDFFHNTNYLQNCFKNWITIAFQIASAPPACKLPRRRQCVGLKVSNKSVHFSSQQKRKETPSTMSFECHRSRACTYWLCNNLCSPWTLINTSADDW